MDPVSITIAAAAVGAISKAVVSLLSQTRSRKLNIEVTLEGRDGSAIRIDSSNLTPEAVQRVMELIAEARPAATSDVTATSVSINIPSPQEES